MALAGESWGIELDAYSEYATMVCDMTTTPKRAAGMQVLYTLDGDLVCSLYIECILN